jgi:predicted nucleotidyltransferase
MAAQKTKIYSVPIPAGLDAQIRADMTNSGFNSISEYVRDALRGRLERSEKRRLEAGFFNASHLGGAIATLRAHQGELLEMGVLHASIFGSTARGEATPKSDVDIAVEIDPARALGVFEFASMVSYVQSLIPRADVVERRALKARVRDQVDKEAVDVF